MEPWGTAIFLVLLALAVVALGAIVSRMVKSIDPNDAAGLAESNRIVHDALFADHVQGSERDDARARRFAAEQTERNEMTWAWRLNALETRVRELEEKSRRVEARSFDVEMRSLQLSVNHAADKARTALQTANEALVVAHKTDTAVQDVIDSATLRAAVALHANAVMKDSTPEDDSEEERVAAIEVDGYCVHGNPVQFHYEGGCDT